MELEEVIASNFHADIERLKESVPNSVEFEYFWSCLEAYRNYQKRKNYFRGFNSDGQSNKED